MKLNVNIDKPGAFQKFLQIFTGNRLYFEQINKQDFPFKLGPNIFSIFSNEEFKKLNIRGVSQNFSSALEFTSQVLKHKSMAEQTSSVPATLASQEESENVVVALDEKVPASKLKLNPPEMSDNIKLASLTNDMHLTAAVTNGDGCKSGGKQYKCSSGLYCKSLYCYYW